MMSASIAQSAARLRLAVFVLMVVLAFLYVAGRSGLTLGALRFVTKHQLETTGQSAFIGDAGVALLALASFRLTQMLGVISGGDYFSAEVVRRFRGFAFWLLLMAVMGAASPIVAALIDSPRGQHSGLTLPLHMREVLTVGITLILFLLARLLERARELDAEMREIV